MSSCKCNRVRANCLLISTARTALPHGVTDLVLHLVLYAYYCSFRGHNYHFRSIPWVSHFSNYIFDVWYKSVSRCEFRFVVWDVYKNRFLFSREWAGRHLYPPQPGTVSKQHSWILYRKQLLQTVLPEHFVRYVTENRFSSLLYHRFQLLVDQLPVLFHHPAHGFTWRQFTNRYLYDKTRVYR